MLVVVATWAFLLSAAPGFAATLKIDGGGTNISYDAAAGEDNALTITRSGDNFVFTDAAAIVITPTAPCTAVANVGTCPALNIANIDAQLGDLDDSASYDDSVAVSDEVQLRGAAGGDELTAGNNSKGFLIGDDGPDILTGGASEDDIRAQDGADVISGGASDDILFHGDGADILSGGTGNDRIIDDVSAADGADLLDGGAGLGDSLDLRNRTAPLIFSLNGVADDGEVGEGDNYTEIERADLGTGNDVAVGGDTPNIFSGNEGNDTLVGGGGNDNLFDFQGDDNLSGGAGNDTLFAGSGGDRVEGGEGDDELGDSLFDGSADVYLGGPGIDSFGQPEDQFPFPGPALAISLDDVANDQVIPADPSRPPDNVGADIENIHGGFGADTLIGNDSANEIDGGRGNDAIAGLGGPDALFGEDGDDTIDGGAGIDLIDGGAGVDKLRSRDSDPDEVSCGSSFDTLLADLFDPLTAACDEVSLGAVIAKTKVKLNEKGKGKLKVDCPAAEAIDCEVKVKVGNAKKTLAKAKGTVDSGETEKIKLKLTEAGEQAAAGANKLTAPATTTMTDAAGAKATTSTPKLVLIP